MDPSLRRLADRLALITGATRGIGRAVALPTPAKALTSSSWGTRWRPRGSRRRGLRRSAPAATLLTLDLKRHDKIDALGPTIYQRWEKLDVLVGNAGFLGPLSPLGPRDRRGLGGRLWIGNLTANWRLIRTLDPLLRPSEAGRAIFVTSGVAAAPARLLGPLRRLQGGSRSPGADLRRRGGLHASGPICSILVRPARPCALRPSPARTRLPYTPEDIVGAFVRLAEPACTDNSVPVRAGARARCGRAAGVGGTGCRLW